MVPALFLKALEAIGSETARWAGKKLTRNEEIIALLRRMGFETLEENFESIYAHCLVTFAAEGKPAPLQELFRDKEIVSNFRSSWESGQWSGFSERSLRLVDALAIGDQLKTLRVDVRSELEAFRALFMEMTQKARTPGNQEMAVLLEDVRQGVRGPRTSGELNCILEEVYRYCEARNAPVTQLHLFHRLLTSKLDRFHPPLRDRIEKMLNGIVQTLDSSVFNGRGYGVTDTVTQSIAIARAQARDRELRELDTQQLLLAVVDNLKPDSNVLTVLAENNITTQQIIGGLRFLSPMVPR